MLCTLGAWQLLASGGVRDPEFDKVPFDQWFIGGGGETQLKWTERTLPLLLSLHQRLMARVQVTLDGAEAAKRKGEGQLLFLIQLADSGGRLYQDHISYDLAKVEDGMRAQELNLTESIFVLPGDYAVSLAIYDTATKEHSVKKTRMRIPPLKVDPLPDAWRSLPPVEFVEPTEPTETDDRWFLPKERGKLNLPLTLRHPLQIDVLVNLTPTEEHARELGTQDRNLSIFVPVLKVLSQMTASGLDFNVNLDDISRQKVTYRQNDVHNLDWGKMKASFPQASSGSIDVKSLADRRHNAAFLGSEIQRKCASAEPSAKSAHVVIVLSGPMVFDTGQEFLQPLARLSANCRVYYIRVQMPRVRTIVPGSDMGRHRGFGMGGGGIDGFPGRSRMPQPEAETSITNDLDQLVPLLRPLDLRLFDITTAEQFRKALATIISEISGL